MKALNPNSKFTSNGTSFPFFCLFTGGIAFAAGTGCYFYPTLAFGETAAAWLYILGSVSFLYVDVLEFLNNSKDSSLRMNLSFSVIGSLLYLMGSVGFLPEIFNSSTILGLAGFISGSAFTFAAQIWKIIRLSKSPGGLYGSRDAATALGMEIGALVGALGFLVGTTMYAVGNVVGSYYDEILWIWMVGCCAFIAGALFLGYRHFRLGL